MLSRDSISPTGTRPMIRLTGQQRAQLRDDLLAHRSRSPLNDAVYVRDVLGVSLNTFKKCVAPGDSLSMKRHSFNSIIANASLDARHFGATVETVAQPMNFGGYTKAEYGFLIGRFLIYRRSFQSDRDITRAVLDIAWSQAYLTFKEIRRYKTEGGVWQSNDFTGNIYMHQERVLMSLLAIDNGDVRLTLLHIPSRQAYGTNMGTIRTSGAVLTHGYPKRFFQPVISPVAIEAIDPSKKSVSPNAWCTSITPDMPEHAHMSRELAIAEDHAIVMTTLMARPPKV
jgi:hypothetical protein